MLLQIKFEARNKLLEKYPKIEKCLKCSLCAFKDGYGCLISNYGVGVDGIHFDPVNTFIYNIFDAKEPVKNSNLWLCVSCHKCYEICPYDVNPTEVIEALKEAAFENGYAPKLILGEVNNILSSGMAFPISQSTHDQRSRLGLPSLEKIDASDLAKIARKTGLENKLAKLGRSV